MRNSVDDSISGDVAVSKTGIFSEDIFGVGGADLDFNISISYTTVLCA